MINHWVPTEQQRSLILPILCEYDKFIRRDWDDYDAENAINKTMLDFTGWPINPFQLQTLFEEIGYEVIDREHNGWECDFWIYMKPKDNAVLAFGEDCIVISGCGMTFELNVNVSGVDI